MNAPLVSVVIATYNAGEYLREAIASILNQTIGDLELLVVDDGSTDGTRELVASIQDPRLRYIWQQNAGQTVAKNNGVSEAKGRFVAFCDGDDYWYPNKLAVQLPLFERSPKIGVVYSSADTVDERGRMRGEAISKTLRGDLTQDLFFENFIPFGTAVVRRECLERMGAFDPALSMGIDWDLWLRISTTYHFECYAGPTYGYRIWSGQMSKNWRGRYSSAFRIMEKFMRENPGRIPESLRRRAFANTFANRGRARMREQKWSATVDGIKAIAFDPWDSYSWKTLVRTVVHALGGQAISRKDDEFQNPYRWLQKLVAPLVRRLTAHTPRIFMYHRFSVTPQPRFMAVEDFRRQMVLLKEQCEVVTLAELFAAKRTSGANSKPLAVVTVDDGYEDFYEIAFPVLRELGLKATVFVTTGFIDKRIWLWPDVIRMLLETAKPGSYRLLGYWGTLNIEWHDEATRERLWNTLADRLVFSSLDDRQRAIGDLSAAIGVSVDTLDMERFKPMSWQALQEIVAAGFEIGDHTLMHAYLISMSAAQIKADLGESKATLERRLGIQVVSFAYPNGTEADYDAKVAEHVEQLGYQQAVLSVPGPVSERRRFKIGRVSGECSVAAFGRLVQGFSILRSTER